MPAKYGDLSRLKALMSAAGARRVVAKILAKNDNSKNQIYLGSKFDALNILPFGEIYEDSSEKNQILKAPLTFSWLSPDGGRIPAPHAQLILYPQYPEVRMSGFLKNAEGAPAELMVERQYGRVMFLGIDITGAILGVVIPSTDDLAKEFQKTVAREGEEIFYELPIELAVQDAKKKLLSELRRIHELGWIDSKRLLANGTLGACEAQNCGGYTLEAELGVKPNGFSEPDYLGWEVKQHGVLNIEKPTSGGPITLMTPEPTAGFYKTDGVEAFLRKYGYPDRGGREDRINFGGVYRVGTTVGLTKLTMVLDGYDVATEKLLDISKGISLIDDKGKLAAVWTYSGMIKHWARKHERAVYVASNMRTNPELQYRYAKSILLGQETDFFRFLKAMSAGLIYYDPAIKLEGASTSQPRAKRRNQFRVRPRDLPPLYKTAQWVELTS